MCSAFLTLCILSHQLQSWFAATKLSIAVIQHRAIKHNSTLLYWSMDIKNTSNYILNERSSEQWFNEEPGNKLHRTWTWRKMMNHKTFDFFWSFTDERRKKYHKPFLCIVGSCVLKILGYAIFTTLNWYFFCTSFKYSNFHILLILAFLFPFLSALLFLILYSTMPRLKMHFS